MRILAVYNLKNDRTDAAGPLAAALKVTRFEALSVLRKSGSGPFVVSAHADAGQAENAAASLRDFGFDCTVVDSDELKAAPGPVLAESFKLGESHLTVWSRTAGEHSVAYANIELILHGTAVTCATEAVTGEKGMMTIGKSLVTEGLTARKHATKTPEGIETQLRERFLDLWAEGLRVSFREQSLSYEGLGSVLKRTSSENMPLLISEFRKRAPWAVYDERLLTRPAQAALLGGRFVPEQHLEIAIALLAKVLRLS